MFHRRASKKAFSLVELSIVLVILGLLAGGILSGQALIKAAALRSVTSDFQRYQTAVLSFRDKYFALPGDMNNAVKFWGAQTGTITDGVNAACAAITTGSITTATCNGDGDGTIDFDNGVDTPHEGARAGQHLANAGLIEGQYSGIYENTPFGPGPYNYRPGVNTPRSKFSNNAVWGMWYMPASWGYTAGLPSQNFITIGSIAGTTYAGRWYNPLLTPEEAWNIDKKMDDGKPYTGKLVDMSGAAPYTPACTNSETFATADYVLTTTSAACIAMFGASF